MPYAAIVADLELKPVAINKVALSLHLDKILFGGAPAHDNRIRFLYSDGTPYTADTSPLHRSAVHGEAFFGLNCTFTTSDGQERSFLIDTVPLYDRDQQVSGALAMGREMAAGSLAHHNENLSEPEIQRRILNNQAENGAYTPAGDPCNGKSSIIPVEARNLLIKHSLEAIETDRKLVAKELHDSIGASLAAIKLYLEEQQSKLDRFAPDLEVSLEKPIAYLIRTIKETKRISVKMSPLILDELGLLATIKWYGREFGELYPQMEIVQNIDIVEDDIPANHKITLYRILQEAVNNAAKHGRARTVTITLKKTDGHITMGVADDGCGFDQQRIASGDGNMLSGYGISGMRERVNLGGGVFDLTSTPGSGTRIQILLPCRQTRQPA
jgi:signal transduction histidine kinase